MLKVNKLSIFWKKVLLKRKSRVRIISASHKVNIHKLCPMLLLLLVL